GALPIWRTFFVRQRFAQCQVVVDLAVEHQHIPTAGRMHGLATCLTRVDDCKAYAPPGQADAFVFPIALAIGTPVPHAAARRSDQAALLVQRAPYTDDSTHAACLRLVVVHPSRRYAGSGFIGTQTTDSIVPCRAPY